MTNKKPPAVSAEPQKKRMGLIFDWQDWVPYLDDANATDAQKREMIETLWQIVVAFVDLGFDLNPTQQAQTDAGRTDTGQESCGQNLDLKMLLEAAVLKSVAVQDAKQKTNNRKPKHKEPTP